MVSMELVQEDSQEKQHVLLQANALLTLHRFWTQWAVSSGDSFLISCTHPLFDSEKLG